MSLYLLRVALLTVNKTSSEPLTDKHSAMQTLRLKSLLSFVDQNDKIPKAQKLCLRYEAHKIRITLHFPVLVTCVNISTSHFVVINLITLQNGLLLE